MRKFVCTVCGYIYDEASGSKEDGIAPGTKWEDVPDDWVCPVCGASKDEFEEQKAVKETAVKGKAPSDEDGHELRKLSYAEMSALFSNLAKGCEKQYKPEEAEKFYQLADYYNSLKKATDKKEFSDIKKICDENIDDDYPDASAAAKRNADRGALRALVWGEKVTKIIASILSRY